LCLIALSVYILFLDSTFFYCCNYSWVLIDSLSSYFSFLAAAFYAFCYSFSASDYDFNFFSVKSYYSLTWLYLNYLAVFSSFFACSIILLRSSRSFLILSIYNYLYAKFSLRCFYLACSTSSILKRF
jgi:hypothetical protein